MNLMVTLRSWLLLLSIIDELTTCDARNDLNFYLCFPPLCVYVVL